MTNFELQNERSHHPKAEFDQTYHLSLSEQIVNQQNAELEVVQRANHVRHFCQGKPGHLKGLPRRNENFEDIIIDKERKFMFCPIFKVSSTFFTRLFYSLRLFGEVKNPYRIPIGQALQAKTHNLNELLPHKGSRAQKFLSNATSFLIVREPLSRLLSGYMDKLFAPNPYFWNKVGNYIVSRYRPQATPIEKICGHNSTFNNFVHYVVDVNTSPRARQYRDAHFIPANEHCKICRLNYTLVGKIETLSTDLYNILRRLDIVVTKDQLADWKKDVVKDAIIDSVESPFLWRHRVSKCMPWSSALKRVWRKLQSRAIIPLEEKFPFSESRSNFIKAKEFIATAYRTYLRADKTRLKRQKRQVLAMAYKTVQPITMAKLLKNLEFDFKLFQYSSQPDFLFDKNFVKETEKLPNIFDMRGL